MKYADFLTMKLVIVPDSMRAAINAKLDAAFLAVPDAVKDREALYEMLLAHFDEHGVVPDFTLEKREATAHENQKRNERRTTERQ